MSDLVQKIINNDFEDKSNDVVAMQANLTLLRGVVVETLSDPSLRLDEAPPTLANDYNTELYRTSPRNSVICRITTDGDGSSTTSDIVCFPFFSSHFALPVKSGEQVWVMRENPSREKSNVRHYWLSRVPGTVDQEDPNFTVTGRSE